MKMLRAANGLGSECLIELATLFGSDGTTSCWRGELQPLCKGRCDNMDLREMTGFVTERLIETSTSKPEFILGRSMRSRQCPVLASKLSASKLQDTLV
jgi:hypothetical protein